MIKTPDVSDSFIKIEEPIITGRCAICGAFIKQGAGEGGELTLLDYPLQIRTIQVEEDGRVFSTVNTHFQHTHQNLFARII